MAFDWNDYLEIAKAFKADTDGQAKSNVIEAKQRTAVSRAYYATYNLAVDYAKNNLGYTPTQSGANQHHYDVRLVYQSQLANPAHQEVRKILARLHKARIDCDYKPEDLGNLQSLLGSVIMEADKVRGTLTR